MSTEDRRPDQPSTERPNTDQLSSERPNTAGRSAEHAGTARRSTHAGPGSSSRPDANRTPEGKPAYQPDLFDRPVRPSKLGYNLAMIAAGIIVIAAFYGTGMDLGALLQMPGNIWQYGQLMLQGILQPFDITDPDDVVRGYWIQSFNAMIESVAIAWIGTIIGALFSLPMGFLAARNMSPLGIYLPTRFVLAVIRAVPEIIFAIAIMIPLFGVGGRGGALAGAFALGISAIGTLSKLISEAVEAVDTGPLESARASGANQVQMIRWAVLPQVMPEVIAIWLYRFEVNIRASAILGVLGAGGIGALLSTVFDARAWDRIGIVLVAIVVVTIIVDQISAFIRHRVIHGAAVRARRGGKADDDGGSGGDTPPVDDDPAPKEQRAAAGL
ncbi:phosphonate ABC transporter, permease protein PhnE [Nesterenkonia sp.]|uniref:phosphonate ABC transporter, permease protein PhnE n=1 Tax=Nesterenkonia sp. TaxID=704201 RepID=UPI002634C4AD|nr:phosphonate ABC transporter, permease protein PhnE [Nesterenkonia sp.]